LPLTGQDWLFYQISQLPIKSDRALDKPLVSFMVGYENTSFRWIFQKFARRQAAISDRKAMRMIFFFYLLILKQV